MHNQQKLIGAPVRFPEISIISYGFGVAAGSMLLLKQCMINCDSGLIYRAGN